MRSVARTPSHVFAGRHAQLRMRRLRPGSPPAVAAHFLALTSADRAARFQSCLSDEAVAAYVARLDFARVILIGATVGPSDAVVGLAEAHLGSSWAAGEAEVAVSVLAPWRRRGLGRTLVAAASCLAFRRGAAQVHLCFAPENVALVRIVLALGGYIDIGAGHAILLGSKSTSVPFPVKPFTASARAVL